MPKRANKSKQTVEAQRDASHEPRIYESPLSQFLPQESEDSPESAVSSRPSEDGSKFKRENTLSILTKRFIRLIKSKDNFVLDINEATRQLEVQKRRIYDITNVLEGIGYIQKIHKNKMKWVGGNMNTESHKEVMQLDQQIETTQQRTKLVEEQIMQLTHKLRKEAEEKTELNYYLEEDLHQIMANLEEQPGSMVVIGTAQGGELEVREHEVIIKGSKGSHGMTINKLRRKNRPDSFSILK